MGQRTVTLKSQLVISISQGRVKILGTRPLLHNWQYTEDFQGA